MYDAYERKGFKPRILAEPSGVARRLVSYIVDSLILGLYSIYMKSDGMLDLQHYFENNPDGIIAQYFSNLIRTDLSAFIFQVSLLAVYIPLFFYIIIPTTLFGGTIGQLLNGLKVVDVNNKRLGFGRSILRAFWWAPLLFILPFIMKSLVSTLMAGPSSGGLGFLMIVTYVFGYGSAIMQFISIFTVIFTEKNRTVHDIFAGTNVVIRKSLTAK